MSFDVFRATASRQPVEAPHQAAEQSYARLGVDADAALRRLGPIAVSVHGWLRRCAPPNAVGRLPFPTSVVNTDARKRGGLRSSGVGDRALRIWLPTSLLPEVVCLCYHRCACLSVPPEAEVRVRNNCSFCRLTACSLVTDIAEGQGTQTDADGFVWMFGAPSPNREATGGPYGMGPESAATSEEWRVKLSSVRS